MPGHRIVTGTPRPPAAHRWEEDGLEARLEVLLDRAALEGYKDLEALTVAVAEAVAEAAAGGFGR